ncbi:MAG: hypothetical protein QM758_22030 [Armatimonas sp.]
MEIDYAASLTLASDPTTPANTLERLWMSMGAGTGQVSQEGNRVMDAIARNPNLPAKLAPACLGFQAKALSENPALPLLMLECPDIAQQSPVERLLRTLRRSDTPTEVVRLLAQHQRPIIAEAARLHVSLAGELAENEVEAELRKELEAVPAGGKEKLQQLHDWGLVPEWAVKKHKLKPASEPQLPAKGWNYYNHRRVPETLPITELIASYRRGEYRPIDFLHREDLPEELKRASVAENLGDATSARGLVMVCGIAEMWSAKRLHEHALSRNWLNRLGVALNKQTPEKDLQRLQKDANRVVRGAATYRASASRGFGQPEPHQSA